MIEEARLPARYLVQSRIGAGSIGVVYRALDTQINQSVAVKVLSDVAPAARESLTGEFRILSRLCHRSLVKVLDFGLCENNTPYFSMEYIDGPDLQQYFAEPLALTGIATLLTDILSALHYLTMRGIVHGDIKPENILIRDGASASPVLADFGLATLVGKQTKTLIGTPRFLAPEVLADRKYSVRSDLYALGHTLIESITGCETPPAPRINTEYLERAQILLEEQFRRSEAKHPADFAHIITGLAHPSEIQRTETPTNALQQLRALDVAENTAAFFSDESHIERVKEETTISDFILGDISAGRVLLLEGIRGCGKKNLLKRAAGISQLEGHLVLNTIPKQRMNVDIFIDLVASSLPIATGADFLSKHRELVARLTTAQKQEDLVNVGVIHDNIANTLHVLSQEKPILLLIADFEQHDEDLVYLVGQLVHEAALYDSRIKFIISRNIDAVLAPDRSLRQQKLLEEMGARKLDIRGFEFEQYLNYFQALFQDPVFSPEEHNKLFEWSRGIPQVLVDHLRFLLGTGIITFSSHAYHVDRSRYMVGQAVSGEHAACETLFLDLDHATLDMLRLLALYDAPLHIEEIKNLLGRDPDDSIDVCLRRGLLENIDGLRIASPTYSTYIVDAIPKDDRKTIQERIADYLVVHDRETQLDAARHYIAAGIVEKAYIHGMAAVEQMLDKHQHFTCNNLLNNLASLLRDSSDQTTVINVQKRLCESNITLGLVDEALNGYENILSSSLDPLEKANAAYQIGRIHSSITGNRTAARQHYLVALSHLSDSPSQILEANIYLHLGYLENNIDYLLKAADLSRNIDVKTYIKALSLISYINLVSGDFQTVSEIEQKLSQYSDSGDPEILFNVLDAKNIICFYSGRYEEAKTLLYRLIEIAEKSCNQIEIAHRMDRLAGIYYINGSYFRQIDILNKACFLIKKYRANFRLLPIYSNISLGYIYLAMYRNAIEHIQEGNNYVVTNLASSTPYFFCSVASSAYCKLGSDYTGDFKKWIDELERVSRKSDIKIGLGHAHIHRGNKSFLSLDYNTALNHYREAATIYESTNIRDDHVEALLRSAECLIELDDREEATRHFKKAEEIFEVIGCQYLAPLYWYVRGMLEASAEAGSAGSLLTALNISTKQGTREMTWQIQRALAEYHLRSGNLHEASNYYRAAVATLKQITEPFQDERMVRSYLDVPLRHRLFEEIHALRERL